MPSSLPNFIVFGVQKAGTTSLYNYLKQHPQIYMSPIKETNFFERDWSNASPEVKAKKRNGITSLEKYNALFAGATTELAVGEVSPNYLFHHQVAVPMIRQHLPQVKLIAILRNPVERAYSDYLMHVRDVLSDQMDLASQVKFRANSSFMLRKGLYSEPLQHFYDVFGEQQIRVFLYDDLCRDAVRLMQEIYQFLGVDGHFQPDTSHRAQVARVPKNKTLNSLLRTRNPVRSLVASALRMVVPTTVRNQWRERLLALNSTDKSQRPLLVEERRLLLDYYRDDIDHLQTLIGRDLSVWLDRPRVMT